jgi:hypothetical protein
MKRQLLAEVIAATVAIGIAPVAEAGDPVSPSVASLDRRPW